ncbi:hypothetical protein [Flagellimonas eckloniae]|uniref:Uncharacterized protein n=1 Tax=Flagellimonas eckloniae TaxID=346185 RepID=A0A0Q1DSM3_9FLAO|nr:hypothetical protein [Allomuricauda eckloniae]KQC31806.1 hypothetical protein AAY42_16000 [Allomuricauda eckloniae]
MKSKLLLLILFTIGFNSITSAQLNDYKYIIVPKKFDAYKTENKHLTSTKIKHLFVQKGFSAVYDDALPEDLSKNRCLGLLVNLVDNSSMFSTKTTLVLKDCQSLEVFKTVEGKSKIKEFKAAYSEAIEKAFVSIKELPYQYTPKKQPIKAEEPLTVSFKNDVKSIEEKPKKSKVVIQEATQENQSFKTVEPVASTIEKKQEVMESKPITSDLLYAQPTENGYQLIDSTPKVVLKLISTSMDNVFMIGGHGAGNGLVFKKNDKWFLESTENGEKKLTELNIKF